MDAGTRTYTAPEALFALWRVLLSAGHVGIEAISTEGLCDFHDKQATVAKLRTSTGSRREREWTGDLAARLRDALNATGLLQARVADATYSEELYQGGAPALVLALHFHRDPRGRAMAARPDLGVAPFHTIRASQESQRFIDRWHGGYTVATGIPVTAPLASLNMTQLYAWCYLHEESAATILEFGNANEEQDRAAMYEPAIARIVRYTRDCVLEHFNLTAPPTEPPRRGADDIIPPRLDGPRTNTAIALELEYIALELRAKEPV